VDAPLTFQRQSIADDVNALVSIVMPAYKAAYNNYLPTQYMTS
jgi:hypothetical protein